MYRLSFDDGWTAVCYLWHPSQGYRLPGQAELNGHAEPTDPAGQAGPARQAELNGQAGPGGPAPDSAAPFAAASGSDLFEASHAVLDALGIRVPQIYLLDRNRASHPADLAVVEDLRGGSLEQHLQSGTPGADVVLANLASDLRRMHRHQGQYIGQAGRAGPATGGGRACEQIVLDRAISDLGEAAGRLPRVAAVRNKLTDTARDLAAAIRPRAQYGLIHGELGPDHVLLDDQGSPALIDTEGVMYFDIEWEHAFLELRFGPHYRWLRASDLDERRLRFYRLAQHLSLIAGPLRLLDGDFPDGPMMTTVETNTDAALAFLS